MKINYKVIAIYCFTEIDKNSIMEFRENILSYETNNISGLIILGEEGINGTICGPEESLDKLIKYIKKFLKKNDLNEKISFSDKSIFKKLKVRIKSEIVTIGIKDINPKSINGIYLDADKWNELIKDESTILIDTRNFYEVNLGTFKNAINPKTNNFREFPKWVEENLEKKVKDIKNHKIAMFCTGGIRCEKASAYLKHHGFEDVNQLHGGIIDYNRQLKQDISLKNHFEGRNFVFDERRGERVSNDIISSCHQCGKAYDVHVNCSNVNCNLLFIQCDSCKKKYQNCCSLECIEIISMPKEKQKILRKGKNNNKMYYSHKRVKLNLKNK